MVARKKMVVIAAAVVFVAALIIMMPYIQALLAILFHPTVPAYSDYQIQRDLILEANGGVVNNVSLDLPAPGNVNLTGEVQTVSDVSYSMTPTESMKAGVPWLTWSGGMFQGSERFDVRITFSLHVEAKVWHIAASDSLNASDIPSSLKTKYSGDEWKIVVDDPRIVNAAQSIAGGEQNAEAALRDIYDWITTNVHYYASSSADPASSVETLLSRAGDCDDQAILFCALARASGIPAWLQLGALYDRSTNEWGGHGWVQSYIPLKAGGGEYVVIDTVNREFLVWSPNKFLEYTDDGDAAHLYDYYYSFHLYYDELTYPPGVEPVFTESYATLYHHDSSERIALAIGAGTMMVTSVTRPGIALA
ncbi:MAG: transglutaminase-like domain-containing protein [Methanomassiliicoccales archaeon]|nr:transglutaminase-like domain-containing protein [Methanomassiliicoccales archaeon]